MRGNRKSLHVYCIILQDCKSQNNPYKAKGDFGSILSCCIKQNAHILGRKMNEEALHLEPPPPLSNSDARGLFLKTPN